MVWERDHKRREFLKLAAFSLAGLTTTGARGLGQARRETIQRPDTPERALSLLVEGNQRFVAQNLISFKEDLDILKADSASLEYGAAVLGVKAIVALGHTNCGAVKATIAGKPVPGQISTLYQYIYPAIAGSKGDLTTASRQNAKLQASVLSETSPVLAELVKAKKLAIRAALYDVGNGKVTMIEA